MSEDEIMEEFLSLGFIGLSRAINSFSIEMVDTVNFELYASEYIYNEILNDLNQYNDYELLSLNDKSLGLDNIVLKNDSIEEFIGDDYVKYIKESITKILDVFGGKSRIIVENYFGLNGLEEMEKDEICLKYNISKPYVNNVIKRIKKYSGYYAIGKIRGCRQDFRTHCRRRRLCNKAVQSI